MPSESGVLAWRIGANVSKIQVEGNDRTLFALADHRHVGIRLAGHALVANGHGVMARAGNQFGRLGRQVLIDLELERQLSPETKNTV